MAKNTVMVKGKGNDHKTLLFERHPLHPLPEAKGRTLAQPGSTPIGEVFVVNDGKEYEVGRTPRVQQLIGKGILIPVESSASAATNKGEKSTTKKRVGTEPWEGYDEHTVDDILGELQDSDEATRAAVLTYERANSKRTGVITPLVNWNSGKS